MLKHRRLGPIKACRPSGALFRYFVPQRTGELESNGYQVTVSAEEYRSVNNRVPHHRVVSGVLKDAQTSPSRSHKSVQSLGCVSGRMNRDGYKHELGVTVILGYAVSAEGHWSVNEWVVYHRVVLSMLRDAQTSASRSHTSV